MQVDWVGRDLSNCGDLAILLLFCSHNSLAIRDLPLPTQE